MVRTLRSELVDAWSKADEETRELVEAILVSGPLPKVWEYTDDWVEVAKAYKHPMILAMDRVMQEIHEAWMVNFARGALKHSGAIDQREVDERRGRYIGARYALHVLPLRAKRRLEKAEEGEEVTD